MGGFWSSDTSTSTQVANTDITQQYSGTCQISCNNQIDSAKITLINDNIGGDVKVTQTCSVNGQCLMNSSVSALADTTFKAANAASSALQWLPHSSTTMSYQEINENIQQYVNQKCKITSSNEIGNAEIYAVNTYVAGGIAIDQNATAGGSCSLSSLMGATAKATGIADNCAASGKAAKKKSCGGKGKGGGLGTFILYAIIAMVLFTGVMMVIKYMRGTELPDCTEDLLAKNMPCKRVPGKTNTPRRMTPRYTPQAYTSPTPLVQKEVYAEPLSPSVPLIDTPTSGEYDVPLIPGEPVE